MIARYHAAPENIQPPVPLARIDKESGGELASLFDGTDSGVRGRRRGIPWNAIHLHVASGQVISRDISHVYGGWIPGPDYISFGADLSILHWLRFGLAYAIWQRPGTSTNADHDFYTIYGDEVRVAVAFVPLRPGMISIPVVNRLELAVESGIALRFLVAETPYFDGAVNESILGLTAGMALAYYPVDQVSIGPVVRAIFYPGKEPGATVTALPDSYDLLLRISLHL
jgi:hypothetical protein